MASVSSWVIVWVRDRPQSTASVSRLIALDGRKIKVYFRGINLPHPQVAILNQCSKIQTEAPEVCLRKQRRSPTSSRSTRLRQIRSRDTLG